jgi:hypothetical protein
VQAAKNGQYKVPNQVGMEMMVSFNKSPHEDVVSAFPIMLDVELRSTSTVLRSVKCELGRTKTTGFTLRKLCQQLTPHLPEGQQVLEWQLDDTTRCRALPAGRFRCTPGGCDADQGVQGNAAAAGWRL